MPPVIESSSPSRETTLPYSSSPLPGKITWRWVELKLELTRAAQGRRSQESADTVFDKTADSSPSLQ